MSSETTGDMALIQDEDTLRKMWQETDDFGKKKEIRSHMYKVREARLKDFYNAGEETTTSAESKQHSTIRTSHHSSTTGLKGSDLTTHADSLADHSFLSLKSKEIRDSESPTKDSYKIIETRKINDRDWNVVESNEASKDGKTHSTSRIATTSGRQDLDGGEMKYAAKSEQKASVFKDGDDKNFTKSVQAASQNVIKQEASGGDENSKFYTSSTTTTSSSKFSSEQRSSADDVQNYGSVKSIRTKDVGNRIERFTYDVPGSESETKTVIRKVYTENIPNELKNHPSYVDGNTKVTTETRTLPDGSTVTTTRYETKGATQYSTTSSKTSSTKHISSSNEQKTSSDNIVKSHVISHDDLDDTRSTRSNSISSERADRTIKNRSIDSSRKETHHQESDIKRIHDLELLGRDSKDAKNIEIIIKKQNIPQDESRTVTTTTVTKTIHSDYNDQTIPDNQDSKTTVITTKSYRIPAEDTVTRSSSTTTKKINSNYDKQQVASTDFLDTERRHVTQTKTTTTRIEDDQKIPLPTRKEITETETVNRKEITVPSTPKTEPTFVVKKEFPSEPCKKPPETIEIEIVPIRTPLVKEEPKYDQPERRQPIKPGKSELDERPTPTEGQYDTTYRTDYVPRRISVEVSPTHDAFARSLRSISPDRISKTGSVRSLRTTSTTSLRSTSSPDRHPGKPNKAAPVDSRPTSPTKKVTKTPEKYPTYNPEIVIKKRPESPEKKTQRTITKQAEDRHTDTLTKKKKTTSTTSISTTTTETRNEVDSSTLTRKTRPVERPRSRSASPTSIASDIEFVRHRTDLVTDLDTDEITNTKLLRRHTEEFDKQPLGDGAPNKKPQKITDKSATLPLLKKSPSKEPEDSSVDKPKSKTIRRTDTYEERCKEILGISNNKDTPSESSPTTGDEPSRRPQKPSETIITVITKDIKSTHKFPQKKEPNQEVPSETKRSPQKQPLEPYREKPRDIKKAPTVQEFPSQTRRSSEKEPLKPYPEKPKESKKQPSVQEFPSQIRKSPQKEPLEPYPEKPKDNKKGSSVQEFPSQTRRSPQKEPLDSYPEKPRVSKKEPLVKEFPSQTRRSPQKEPLEAYPEKPKNEKKAPTVQEFPSQTRRSPQKEPLEPYPERPKESKRTSLVQEFPSQTRSSEKEPLEPYPVKPKDSKKEPSVQEFPSQIRRSPKKEPLEPFLEKPKDNEKGPSIQEFPSQKRPSSQKEPFEPYPEKPKDIKKEPCVQEFPSQIRFPQEEFLEAHPKEPKDDKKTPNVRDFPSQTGRYPQKEPLEPYPGKPKEGEKTPLIEELPCQTRRIPQKEPLEPYPEKPKGDKKAPTVQEFPSQIRKSPQKEPLEAYPEKPKDGKKAPSVQEFPSQIRTSPQKEVLERYPEKPKDDARKIPSKIQEFPSHVKKPSDISLPTKKGSLSTHETPEQTLEPSDDYPDEYDSDLDEPLQRAPSKVSLDDIPTIKTEKVSLDDLPKVTTKRKSIKETPGKVSLDDLRPKPKPQKVVDNFITNEKVDTEITLKKYKDDSIHKPKGIPDVTSTTDSKTTTKKSKVVKKTKKIISGTAEDEMESSTTEDEEQEDVEEIEDQIVEDIEILDVQRTDKRTKTTTRIEEVDERKLPRKPSGRPSSKKPADIDDLESQIIDDETNEFTTVTTTTTEEVQQRKGPTKEDTIKTKKQPITGTKSPDKTKPKSKLHEPHVEDFITVTRTQLLQTESKVPIEEPVHVKKFITTLCEDEEQDRMTQEQIILVQKERKIKTMPTEEKMPKPTSVVKKDQPEKARFTPKKTPEKKKPDEAFIRKEKLDTIVTSKIDSRRTIPKRPVDDRPSKQSGRKIPDDQKVIKTEYMEQFTVKTKPKTTSLTPVKQPSRKPSPKGAPTVTDTTLHFKVQKVDSTTTRKGINVLKVTQVDKKPIAPKTPSKKRPDDQQPKQPAKLKVPEIKQPRTTSPSIKTTTTVQKTVEVRPPKRHVVSTIINIKPKQKPETITNTIHKTTVTKTILAPKTSKITTKPLKQKPKPIVNGHVSTDEEVSDIENVENVIPRGVSKVPRDHATPTRSSPLNTTERKKKCITTKSILIENAVADQREIIVDLKRSKSSREGTPDRICPYPISADSDQGIPRYPDRIIEPEDGGQRPKRISDIPLMETEDVHDFNRITEIAEDRRRTTKTQVDTTDECLLSVNEKVNKFLSTAEQITNKPLDGKPAPKVERPRLDIDESLKEDECLLSVSDKVSRFIATAEQLASSTTRETIQRPKSPRPRDPKPHQPEDTPQTKDYEVSRATKTTEVRKSISPERKPQTIERKSPDHPARSPDRKLQSYTLERMSPERKRELDTSKAKSPERKPISDSPKSKTPERKPETDTTRYKTPERKSDTYSRKTTEEIVKIRKQSFEDETTPKSSRRLSKDETKTVLSPTGRLRSTETIKKAKALFENIGKEQDIVRQKDILNRPSIFEGRKLTQTEEKFEKVDERKVKDVRTKLTYDEVRTTPSPDKQPQPKAKVPRDHSPDQEVPHYMTPLDRTVKEHRPQKENPDEYDLETLESDRSRGTTPDKHVPHYMLPLDRSLRERSPHKENVKQLEDIMNRSNISTYSDETEIKNTKFGVTLRRTDSGRVVTVHKKLSTSSVDDTFVKELDIEEIWELEYLEKLLETVVGYDIRRRIRAQIRVIKRATEEGTLETLIKARRRSPRKESPIRQMRSPDKDDISQVRRYSSTDKRKQTEEYVSHHASMEVSEYQSSYKRKTSSEYSSKTKSPSISPTRDPREPSPKKEKSTSPERKGRLVEGDATDTKTTTTTTTTKIFQTDLKKSKPTTKTVVEEKPEWITQRTLRKVSETTVPVKKTVTTTTTTQKLVTKKDGEQIKQPIDVITSSYGVGPTDENGTPLFGLKALRAQNKSEKTKENGAEPTGEISVTKFSSDPKDLEEENLIRKKGIASVTTTQKFGYKGTPSLKTITGKTEKTTDENVECKTSSLKTSKITRRGSVKEISQKFIENAVDTLKSERQPSYPKAGLILRTSSFKDSPINGTGSGGSREGSPATQDVQEETVTTVETRKRSATSGVKKADTFLSNRSKVTGVQDVLSRMRNEAEIEDDETLEDAEAKNLLNKFIGSQVLLSEMESHSSKLPVSVSPDNVKRTTKITTTTTSLESSKPTTVTRTFTHPITTELLENIWDEQTLKLLLEQSTDYEDRRIIRARLREIMAEQEACAELVKQASEDSSSTKEAGSAQVHGESLLLPLLQGLLDQPENDQPADSGTESGEDLRSGLILEVQGALDKLSASLKSPSTNISEERRESLLQLVNRLQSGLSSSHLSNSSTSSSLSSNERRSSLHQAGRFSRRKQRANRHTVGVSSEELEDARRLMEEIAFRGSISAVPPNPSGLQKQNSEGSVLQTPPFKPLSKAKPVKNVTAKPFVNTIQNNQSGTSSTVDTPSETSGSLEFLTSQEKLKIANSPLGKNTEKEDLHPHYHHSKSLDHTQYNQKRPPFTETMSLDLSSRDTVDLISIQKAVTQAAAIKQLSQMKFDVSDGAGPVDETDSEEETEDEEDDDQATVKTALQQEIKSSPTQQQPQPDLIMQTNPIYNKPSEERDTTNNNSENDEYPSQLNEKANRFNSKKLKMKRANTIDIPKPLKYYECDEDDSDNEDFNNRRHSYLALRGPIRVGKLNVEKKVPEFEPKTESDKKFMAFLGKHTENAPNTNRTTLWCNQQPMNKGFAGSNWSNKFGNVKNNFEKMQTGNSVNSARNFWKSADDAVVARRAPQFGPKISRQSAKNLQQMFEEKHKQTQQAQQTQPQRSANQTIENVNQNNNIVTGTLKVDTSKTNKNVAVVVTQPNSINKFSHAPMSAFKPVAKKIEIPYPMQQLNPPQQSSYLKPKPLKITPDINSNFQSAENNKISSKIPDSPLYLYSPKQVSPENASPTNSTPWNSTRASGESRVLSIAATKFQNMAQERDPLPRRMSKEKIVIPPSLINQQKQPQEKLTAPYLVRSVAQGNSVRKLSGQYDNMGNKDVYHDSRTQYGTKAALSSDNRQHNVKPTLYGDQKQQNDQKVSPNYDNKQQNGVRTSTLYSDDSRQFSDNLQQYYSQAALSGDSRDNSNRQQYNVTAVLPSENRQEYSASDKQHCGQYSDTYINLSSDKVEQYDIQPRTFVPGENYTIQYDHPVPVPPQPKVYNAEYIVSQQQYNVPSDYLENARDKEDPYDTAVYHNQQQQIISQIKQTSPNLRQPEVYQETPKYEEENNQYISSYQFKPQAQIPNFKSTENKVQDNRFSYTADIRNEAEREEVEKVFPNETKSPYNPRQNFTYERQTSQESIKEYTAVSSKVMSGPVSQQAVTVQQNAPKSRDQHDMEYNLKATLQKLSSQTEFSQREQQKASVKAPLERKSSLKQGSDPPAMVLYNNVKQRPSLCINDKPLSLESLETNERGEQVLTSKFHIPLKQIQSKSLNAASSASRELSKSESWHQICQSSQQTPSKPSPRGSPNSRSVLRSKSSHSLAVPKQFEAGMSKTEMLEKKRTMEAYFGVSPKAESKKSSSSINRVKTSQKISTQRQNSGGSGGGLCRSKTLPDILCLDKLDDSNIDAIFEDLFNARTTKTTTYTEGPVTTTTQVTTRVTTQEQMKKPMSPFAKFRQLDKQNSLNSPPSTPKSPTTGSPLFKFTDASLNQSANTVKQRLLQWCQMKTKEYENIQLDNFSTSWSDGMAFCALIHHFLPDAFDYNTLNPKNRRHNFTLAFRVADEKAGIAPLLDVDDMVAISRPDWKCVFTYVQSIYRRFKDED